LQNNSTKYTTTILQRNIYRDIIRYVKIVKLKIY